MIDFDKINLNRLYYFYYVATCKNITKAAIEANVYQSSMTRQMIALEKEIGTKLLNRHSDGVTLTRAGEEVFSYAERIAREVGAIRKQLDEKDKISGKIRICTTYAIANYILSEYLFEFNRIYPDIYLDIFCNDYEIDLVKNDVDVVIRPYDPVTKDIIQVPLIKMQSNLYASKGYIEKNGLPKTVQDLSNHKFIGYSRSNSVLTYPNLDWFLKIDGCTSEENCIMRVNSVEMLHKAALQDFGIIVGYENMEILKDSSLIRVASDVKVPTYHMYFTYPKNHESLGKVQILQKFLKDKIEENEKLI